MVRVKNRYIVVKIVPEKTNANAKVSFHDSSLSKCILANVLLYHGVHGLGAVENGFRIKYCNDETKISFIRCKHQAHRFITSILPLITVINNHRAKFQILYVGATIMHCKKFIVNYQRTFLDRTIGQIISAKARRDLINNVIELNVE